MSERRMARASRRMAPKDSTGSPGGGVPWQIMADAVTHEFWSDRDAVRAFIRAEQLPEPHPGYWDAPRALRDHCAYSWMVRSGYVNKWGLPDWERGRALDVLGCGGARARARLASGINS